MAYLGNDLQVAFPVYRNIDDISSSFNSSTTSFPLTVNGVAPVPAPLYSQQCLISVGGVVQRPDDSGTEGFRLSGGNIIFASAPTTGADFFGVILAGADYINAGGNFPAGTASVPSITFNDDLDTGIYSPGINHLSITTGGLERLRIDSAGQIEAASLGTAAAPVFSFASDPNTGIYSPGADQLALSTNGAGRLLVDSSGQVRVGPEFGADRTTHLIQLSATDENVLSIQQPVNTVGAKSSIGFWNRNSNNAAVVYGKINTEIRQNNAGNHIGDLVFSTVTGGSLGEKVRITGAGLVGIGTSSPGAKLTVAQAATNADTDGIRIVDSGGIPRANLYYRGSQVFEINSSSAPGGGDVETLRLSTAGNARLSITRDGKVGIGTQSPSILLDCEGSSTGDGVGLHLNNTSGSNTILVSTGSSYNFSGVGASTAWLTSAGTKIAIGPYTAGEIQFINGGEKARIDSSGRLLVGTSSSLQVSSVDNAIQVEGTNTVNTHAISAIRHGSTVATAGSVLSLGRSRGTSVGSKTAVANGDTLGTILFAGANGTDFSNVAAWIRSEVDGDPFTAGDTTDLPGRLVFSTTADGASSPTERMRITSDAYVRLASGTGGIQFNGDTAAANALDDYEEGAWTPVLSGPTAQTYTSTGRYIKIGNALYIQGQITWTVAPTGGSNYNITLPFSNTTNKSISQQAILITRQTALNTVASHASILTGASMYFYSQTAALNAAAFFQAGTLGFAGTFDLT